MGDTSSPPTPYSTPNATADTQAQYNLQAANEQRAGNMVGQNSIFGNLNYAQTGTGPGGVPLYTATQTLSPQMQAIVNSLQGGVTGQLNTGNYANSNPSQVIGDATSGNTKALLGQETSYLQPFFTQQHDQLDTQLRNQGIGPESPAYTRAMNNLSQSQNQSVTGFLAQAEPAAYQQARSSYLTPLDISQQEMGLLNPSMLTSSFVNPPQTNVAAPNYAGAVSDYNAAQNTAYQNQVAQNTAMMSGAFGIPTAVLGGWAKSGFAGLGGAGAGGTAAELAPLALL